MKRVAGFSLNKKFLRNLVIGLVIVAVAYMVMRGVKEGFQGTTQVSQDFNLKDNSTNSSPFVDGTKFSMIPDNAKLKSVEIFANRKCYSAILSKNFKAGSNATADMINLTLEKMVDKIFTPGTGGQNIYVKLADGNEIHKPTLDSKRAKGQPRWGPNGSVTAKMLKGGVKFEGLTTNPAGLGSITNTCEEPNGLRVVFTF